MSQASIEHPPVSAPQTRSAAPDPDTRAVAPPPGVTARQMECLYWVQHGKSASDIGGILGISPRTVEGHLAKLCEHFGVRTRFQAVLKARDQGLIVAVAP